MKDLHYKDKKPFPNRKPKWAVTDWNSSGYFNRSLPNSAQNYERWRKINLPEDDKLSHYSTYASKVAGVSYGDRTKLIKDISDGRFFSYKIGLETGHTDADRNSIAVVAVLQLTQNDTLNFSDTKVIGFIPKDLSHNLISKFSRLILRDWFIVGGGGRWGMQLLLQISSDNNSVVGNENKNVKKDVFEFKSAASARKKILEGLKR